MTTQPRRILVAIKRVVDYNVRIRVKPDGSGVMLDGVKLSINPFDQIAIEEALRIKERGRADEVVVASIGPADLQATLRNALAMGAQRALQGAVAPVRKVTQKRERPAPVRAGRRGNRLSSGSRLRGFALAAHEPQRGADHDHADADGDAGGGTPVINPAQQLEVHAEQVQDERARAKNEQETAE